MLTGSASGLGFAMAEACLTHGMHVVISDVRKEALDKAVDLLRAGSKSGLHIEGFVCDVTSLPSVEALLASVRDSFPTAPIQFLAANAGVVFSGSTVLTGSAEEWDKTYRVNVLGVAHTLRTFVPVLVAQPQRAIVEITASAAGVGFGGTGPYGTSKLAALGVAEALWSELRAAPGSPLDRISVVALCPALVKTELRQSAGQTHSSSRKGDAASTATAAYFDTFWDSGMSAQFVAASLFQHAAGGKFYCILDNLVHRDGFSQDLDNVITDRYAAMKSRDLKTHRNFRGLVAPASRL